MQPPERLKSFIIKHVPNCYHDYNDSWGHQAIISALGSANVERFTDQQSNFNMQ